MRVGNVEVPKDIWYQILSWCVGGPDDTANVQSLREVNRELKRILGDMARAAWNAPIRNLGLFMLATIDSYGYDRLAKPNEVLQRAWDAYLLAFNDKRFTAYLVQDEVQDQYQELHMCVAPAKAKLRAQNAWLLGHIHHGRAISLVMDPNNVDAFWNEFKRRPTAVGRGMLELGTTSYRPANRDEKDTQTWYGWNGMGVLLVPRRGKGPYLTQAQHNALTVGFDIEDAQKMLNLFVNQLMSDGALDELALEDALKYDAMRTRMLLAVEGPRSCVVPSYWPREGWIHGLKPGPAHPTQRLFHIVNLRDESGSALLEQGKLGLLSKPKKDDFKSDKGVADPVWSCDLPLDSGPRKVIIDYLASAVSHLPYETTEFEAARLKHQGKVTVGTIVDFARGKVEIFPLKDKRYRITRIRVVYSPARWNAYLAFKRKHRGYDLSGISWAGEQQKSEDFQFPQTADVGECFLVHGTAFDTVELIARGGFGPEYCKDRGLKGGYGSLGQGTYLTDNLAKISTYANCPKCDFSGGPCDCVDVDGEPLERVGIISRVFIPEGVKLTDEKKMAYKRDPLTKHPERPMVIGQAGHGDEETDWPNNVFLLRDKDMAYPEMLVFFRWYKNDIA
jgi:hypothetical protein